MFMVLKCKFLKENMTFRKMPVPLSSDTIEKTVEEKKLIVLGPLDNVWC